MKQRAPRNRTLTIDDNEQLSLLRQTITLKSPSSANQIDGKVIHQDLCAALDFLPDDFIDLLVIDPPYNLSKKYGSSHFAKKSVQSYKSWLESWLPMLKRCLKEDASLYVCCDWQSSKPIQSVLEQHSIIRNRITWERSKTSC